jgi:hypothetical protein
MLPLALRCAAGQTSRRLKDGGRLDGARLPHHYHYVLPKRKRKFFCGGVFGLVGLCLIRVYTTLHHHAPLNIFCLR